jgi:hypothetical protein
MNVCLKLQCFGAVVWILERLRAVTYLACLFLISDCLQMYLLIPCEDHELVCVLFHAEAVTSHCFPFRECISVMVKY